MFQSINSLYNCFHIHCCLSKKSTNTKNTNINQENIPSKSFGASSNSKNITGINYYIPNWKDTIPFVPPITEGVIIKVYDGDTITLATSLYIKTRLPKNPDLITNPNTNPNIDQEYQHLNYDVYSEVEFKTYRMSIRLAGIDTPEIKGQTEKEKQMAKMVQEELEKLLLHKVVQLKNIKTEKYGRILADVYLDDLHVNEWMIQNNYAVGYDGKTKNYDWTKHELLGLRPY